MESYRDGVIFYSLGNLVFDQFQRQETQHGLIADLRFTGAKLASYSVIPVDIVSTVPRVAPRTHHCPALMTALVLSAGGMYGAYQAGAWKAHRRRISAGPDRRRFHRRGERMGHRGRLRSR